MVVIGGDTRKPYVSLACLHSIIRHDPPWAKRTTVILDTETLRRGGVYLRQKETRGKQDYDVIDNSPISSDFSFSRFLIPALFGMNRRFIVFCDDDFMWRENIDGLRPFLDDKYAVMVVKHDFHPLPGMKMDGKIQLPFRRKAWSSLIVWNMAHPSNQKLTAEVVNTAPGVYLHQFEWLKDDEIGALQERWNWLEGHSNPEIEPAAVHYTRGGPWLPAYRNAAYANEWLDLHFSSLNTIARDAQAPRIRGVLWGL